MGRSPLAPKEKNLTEEPSAGEYLIESRNVSSSGRELRAETPMSDRLVSYPR